MAIASGVYRDARRSRSPLCGFLELTVHTGDLRLSHWFVLAFGCRVEQRKHASPHGFGILLASRVVEWHRPLKHTKALVHRRRGIVDRGSLLIRTDRTGTTRHKLDRRSVLSA